MTADASVNGLQALLDDVLQLRQYVIQSAAQELERYLPYYPDGKFSPSAINLAQYLALRRRDLRPLQDRLAEAGLSSFGHGEANVLANLNRVIRLLQLAVGLGGSDIEPETSSATEGEATQLLTQRTEVLFGARPEQRMVRIMVTLPSEAAWNYPLVEALMERGMDCARINCAHDDRAAWQAMADNVRRAAAKNGRACRILVDLAGHKVRTGPIATAPAITRIKVRRDVYGNIVAPTKILLASDTAPGPHGVALPELVDYRFTIPEELHRRLLLGDRLYFMESRGKKRYLEITAHISTHYWLAQCMNSTYLATATPVDWQRRTSSGTYQSLGNFHFSPFDGNPLSICLHKGDLLMLTREALPGQPACRDEASGRLISPARISCTYAGLIDDLQPGAPVWIDDGKLGAVVESITEEGALLKITHAGPKGVMILSDKGINVPETRLNLPPLSDKDLEDLDFVCNQADMVGFSFVETVEDMEYLMNSLVQRNAADLTIIAKIETNRAFRHLPEIILGTIGRHSLGIMIARGDLAVELGSVRMSEIQEEILWLCEAGHIPVIWATQVLESLAKKGHVSRPEITDAASSVRAECVMLNKGSYVLDAVEVLGDILSRMQEHQQKKFTRLRALHF
ncbi:MAG TPA: pyruvate kinase [Geobacteraceae bacterium]|nr:pyruvate kinase [Geobacteraceae bacterium]